ncbi:Acetyltransferase (GNAT) domain-containing protein [Amphibacillus marinus]|uniref:Acetyltransferase (GNAT) domain-containing protein n=1 Tax=Amphibacillus marinus TaxID=872970 RepID=A0A1H8Q945_9BACI|nr:GNAT family N-acetyltransferase [Amphibacillus marinus]SEO50752.1 Acetyltransferase (GNAT) domain-containing protein [Amphibacillus marinus]
MDWFEKLNEYFPIHEMKSKEHMERLLKDKSDIYYKDEGTEHVMMYAEFPEFIFIDYLYVSASSRGKGLGHQLITKLKDKTKPIILEVEPIDYRDSDSAKRLHFYKREGFKHAKSIGYNRLSLATNENSKLEILYWSPTNEDEAVIYQQMRHMYEKIHTYKDEEIYGQAYQKVEDVLSYNHTKELTDILNQLEED